LSEASALNSEVPEGWYADPAKPTMQRFWTGTEWTEHVRYSDKPQPLPFAARETAPMMVEMPAPDAAFSLRPIEAPSSLSADRPAVISRMPTAPVGFPESTLDRFYIPMRRFEPSATSGAPLQRRSSARAIVLWVAVVAVVGVAVGVAAWAFLLR
jgi:hypothetical protein